VRTHGARVAEMTMAMVPGPRDRRGCTR
jgi:hypothetical protein